MLGSLILYLKGMRIMMLQLSGFYYKGYWGSLGSGLAVEELRSLGVVGLWSSEV